MHKLILRLLVCASFTCFIISIASAQNYTGFGRQVTKASVNQTPTLSQTLSAEDFRKQVDALSQKNKNQIKETITQHINQQLTPPPPMNTPSNNQTQQATLPAPQYGTVNNSSTTQPSMPSQPTTSQPQNYTGFTPTPTKTGTQTGSSSTGGAGGWNIRY